MLLYMKRREIKTPDYNRRAVDKYRAQFDVVSVRLPLGTAERMRLADFTPADRVQAILKALEEREAENVKKS